MKNSIKRIVGTVVLSVEGIVALIMWICGAKVVVDTGSVAKVIDCPPTIPGGMLLNPGTARLQPVCVVNRAAKRSKWLNAIVAHEHGHLHDPEFMSIKSTQTQGIEVLDSITLEYTADAYAVAMGEGTNMIEYLTYVIGLMDPNKPIGEKIIRELTLRIAHMEELMERL